MNQTKPSKHMASMCADLAQFEKTPACWGFDLQLDLQLLLIRSLKLRGMKIKSLAKKAGVRKRVVKDILDSAFGHNVHLHDVGAIFHALDVKLKITLSYDDLDTQNEFFGD